jgi:hypothetical protein
VKHKKNIIFAIGGLLLILFVTLSMLVVYSLFMSLTTIFVPSSDDISKITAIKLPESAKIIGAQCILSLDGSMYLALEVPSDQIINLFPEEKYSPSTTERYLRNATGEGRQWFIPDSIRTFKSFHYSDEINRTVLYVLYDTSKSSMTKVYIYCGFPNNRLTMDSHLLNENQFEK